MLETGKMYHLYNRGNNRENLFYKDENYCYFIRQFDKYLSNYIDVYAYCLLPNHFHFLIKVKDENEILRIIDSIALSDGIDTKTSQRTRDTIAQSNSISTSKIISEQFRRFFIGYSQAINKQENRVGSLFQKNFKIKEVNSDHYFSSLVFYIHANPQKHGLIYDFRDWNYSSYHAIQSEKMTKLKKSAVIDWFGDLKTYTQFHKNQLNFRNLLPLDLED